MGQWTELETPAGSVAAWQADPPGTPRGGLVVIQEIFGVNPHIRAVADGYAAEGYVVLAPAFFDPVERGVELGYGEDGFARGRALVQELGTARALAILQAAAERLRADLATRQAPTAVGTVGYCWGGSMALLAALRLGLPSVSYYGARNLALLDECEREDPRLVAEPKAMVMFHFGEQDPSIPAEAVAAHRQRLPQMPLFVYPAGHAFNRDVDPRAYHEPSARLARERSLEFLVARLGAAA